jgi:hypothetical protein
VSIVHVVLPDSAHALQERLLVLLRAAGHEPHVISFTDAALLLAEMGSSSEYFIVDIEADAILDAFTRASTATVERSIVVASIDASMLSRVQAAASRGVLGFFTLPCDLDGMIARIPLGNANANANAAPASPRQVPSAPPSVRALPPLGIRQSSPPSKATTSSMPPSPSVIPRASQSEELQRKSDLPDSFGPSAPVASLSQELATFLREAEGRASANLDYAISNPEGEGILLSPEDEVETVLPHDVLMALDSAFDDEPSELAYETIHGPLAGNTTHGSSDAQTTGTGKDRNESVFAPSEPAEPAPALKETGKGTETETETESFRSDAERPDDPSRAHPDKGQDAADWAAIGRPIRVFRSRHAPSIHRVLPHSSDVLDALAEPIRTRSSCLMTFETHVASGASGPSTFRVTISEGYILSVSSSSESDTLSAFLVERGDLLRADAVTLQRRIPRDPRYAAAALVAHGVLHNDELWDVLRGHASWLLAKLISVDKASVTNEDNESSREAPSVFGSSTGASVFVDTVRRVVAPADAEFMLGGASARIDEGPHLALLGECNLEENFQSLPEVVMGRTLFAIADASSAHEDIAVVLYALVQLGVFAVLGGLGSGAGAGTNAESQGPSKNEQHQNQAALDEARRQRIRARAAIVDDGDYFALLGVSPLATGYEIRKSFLELRREFEPSRILTPRTLDLRDDVLRIVEVLEEAYDILRDAVRRERYRKAIRMAPSRGSVEED